MKMGSDGRNCHMLEPISSNLLVSDFIQTLIFGQRLSQTKHQYEAYLYSNYGRGSECFMMNDVTLKQIAAVKAIVSKGKPRLDIEQHMTILLGIGSHWKYAPIHPSASV